MPHDVTNEIIHEIPPEVIARYGADAPLLIAYGCVLLEHDSGKSYAYRAVNLKTGKSANLSRRAYPLTTSGVADMIEKIRLSHIAGAGLLDADMPPGESLSHDRLAEILDYIFWEILPEHGYGVRAKQMELAAHILDAICHRKVSLSEAEVGTGKTIAYLTAAALVKRGRANDHWARGHYPRQSYADSGYQPVVISTSSIALQTAIVKDYIPELSRILMEYGIIKTPLTCVIRKGKEHYACEKNLRAYYEDASNRTKQILAPLLEDNGPIDLGAVDGLTAYVKRRIGLSGRCDRQCPYYANCRYQRHMKRVQSSGHDFQVCNHNYLLADTLRRSKGKIPLIPHYQAIIIDEAHKFLQAARQMYGVQLSSKAIPQITGDIRGFTVKQGENDEEAKKLARQLAGQSRKLFKLLNKRIPKTDTDDEAERYAAVMDDRTAHRLRAIHNIADELIAALSGLALLVRYESRRVQMLRELESIKGLAAAFQKHDDLICWLEKPGETLLRAIPKNLNDMLYRDLWANGLPIVLTSGTLSAAGDFTRIKKSMGLDRLPDYRLVETSKPSPFDFRKNKLLYISENVPFPDQRDRDYILAVATEVEELVIASHGHAAVLFTSYKAMDMVWELLEQRGLPFPLFKLGKSGVREIEHFKQSGNGILFASGAMWEGIDIPGDALSMLIIVKLPFAVPDPISEYERTKYKDMDEYKNCVIVPECMIKTKQGDGRVIRTEKDTGVVAFLDYRVREDGPFRGRLLYALPVCRVTDNIEDVRNFILITKGLDYFM